MVSVRACAKVLKGFGDVAYFIVSVFYSHLVGLGLAVICACGHCAIDDVAWAVPRWLWCMFVGEERRYWETFEQI